MVRRYADPVQVRAVPDEAVDDGTLRGAPTTFLWRGRLYLVREVLGHWRERRAWWATPAAHDVHGDGPPSVPGPRRSPLDSEQEVWRVEASRGRSFGSGVYDLCRDLSLQASAPHGVGEDAWRLVRVAD